jgi:CheY-specific phosphatase CheX
MYPLEHDRVGMVSVSGVVGDSATFSAEGNQVFVTEGEYKYQLVAAIQPDGAGFEMTDEIAAFAVSKLTEMDAINRAGTFVSLAGAGDVAPPRRTPAEGTLINE